MAWNRLWRMMENSSQKLIMSWPFVQQNIMEHEKKTVPQKQSKFTIDVVAVEHGFSLRKYTWQNMSKAQRPQ